MTLLRRLLKFLLVMFLSSLVTVVLSVIISLGFFGLTTILGGIAAAVGLAVSAWVVYNLVGWVICQLFFPSYTKPGFLLMSAFHIGACMIASLLLGAVLPDLLLVSLTGALIFSFVNTWAFWALWTIGAVEGNLSSVNNFLPQP